MVSILLENECSTKKKIRFIDDVLEINYQSCCILSGPPCIVRLGYCSVVVIYTTHKKELTTLYFDDSSNMVCRIGQRLLESFDTSFYQIDQQM